MSKQNNQNYLNNQNNQNNQSSQNNQNGRAFSPSNHGAIDVQSLRYFAKSDSWLYNVSYNGCCYYGLSLWNNDDSFAVRYPSRKGSDGKYYKYYQLSSAMEQEIVDIVETMINNGEFQRYE